MPARYRSRGLEVAYLLPHWADVAYHLEQDPRAMLVVQNDSVSPWAPPIWWNNPTGTR